MAKTNTNTNTNNNEVIDQVKIDTMALSDTSKKIRYLLSLGNDVKTTYKLINSYGVTTKDGKEIRYQHVRNVAMTKLSDKK